MSAAPPVPDALKRAVSDVVHERGRQEARVAGGRFSCTCATPGAMSNEERLEVLEGELEEVRVAFHDPSGCRAGHDLRAELVQVAAVAVAWVEGLDAEASA